MKASKKIFIGILSILAIAMIFFSVGNYVDTGSFDIFSAGIAGVSTKAVIFFMTIDLSLLGQPDDIEYADGTENMGGFGMTAYIGIRSHITTYPTLDATQTDLESLVKLIGDYVFAASRNFITIDFVPDTLKVTPEAQGEHVGGNSFMIKGEGFIPGTGTRNRGIARLLNNCFGVMILIREDGSRLAIGNYQHPLEFKVGTDEGQKAADKKGVLVSFSTSSFVPGYEYYGEVPLDGSTLPAIS